MNAIAKALKEGISKLEEEKQKNESYIQLQKCELNKLSEDIQKSYDMLDRLKKSNFSLDT